MPTLETLENGNVVVTWTRPLTSTELLHCFQHIEALVGEQEGISNVIFKITAAGYIPPTAPFLAVRSGFLRSPKTGKVAVVGMDNFAQTLAALAARWTGKVIKFFPTDDAAMAYFDTP